MFAFFRSLVTLISIIHPKIHYCIGLTTLTKMMGTVSGASTLSFLPLCPLPHRLRNQQEGSSIFSKCICSAYAFMKFSCVILSEITARWICKHIRNIDMWQTYALVSISSHSKQRFMIVSNIVAHGMLFQIVGKLCIFYFSVSSYPIKWTKNTLGKRECLLSICSGIAQYLFNRSQLPIQWEVNQWSLKSMNWGGCGEWVRDNNFPLQWLAWAFSVCLTIEQYSTQQTVLPLGTAYSTSFCKTCLCFTSPW